MYKGRISISVEVVGNRPYGDSKNTALEIAFVNNSQSSVSIDSMELKVTDNSGNELIGKIIGRYEFL